MGNGFGGMGLLFLLNFVLLMEWGGCSGCVVGYGCYWDYLICWLYGGFFVWRIMIVGLDCYGVGLVNFDFVVGWIYYVFGYCLLNWFDGIILYVEFGIRLYVGCRVVWFELCLLLCYLFDCY